MRILENYRGFVLSTGSSTGFGNIFGDFYIFIFLEVKLEFVEKVLATRALRCSKAFNISYGSRRCDSSLVPFASRIQLSVPKISEI